MCGILLKKDVFKLIEAYHLQKERGNEAFGCMIIFEDNTFYVLKAIDEVLFLESLKHYVNTSFKKIKYYLMHHRFPTSSHNSLTQTQPIFISSDGYYIFHNGDVFNYKDLVKEDFRLNWFSTKELVNGEEVLNDSEVLGMDLVNLLEKSDYEMKSKGTMAFLLVKIEGDKVTNIYFGRNRGKMLAIEKDGTLSSKGENVITAGDIYEYCLETGEVLLKKEKVLY